MTRTSLASLLIAAACGLFASSAFAQATRTWVSGVGDDANPCSRTAPCKTFAGAISKTAAGGEISVLDAGGFGALTITKSITLNGEGTLASVLVAGTNGIVVAAGANDVVIIRNLSINGIGQGLSGIDFLTGGKLHVENVSIYGFTGNGIFFAPGAASSLFVSNTSIRNCLRGILIQPGGVGTATAALTKVTLAGNTLGLRAEDGSTVNMRDSSVVGNAANGVVANGSSRAVDITLDNVSASENVVAGVFSGTLSTLRISSVLATRNAFGLQNGGGSIISFGNNHISGNTTADGVPTSTPGSI
jgi:hypothetical protein